MRFFTMQNKMLSTSHLVEFYVLETLSLRNALCRTLNANALMNEITKRFQHLHLNKQQ